MAGNTAHRVPKPHQQGEDNKRDEFLKPKHFS
jgi:hypothetical protein